MTTPQEHQPAPPRRIAPHEEPRITTKDTLHFPWSKEKVSTFVKAALEEDMAFDDVTTIATVLSDRRARARLVARADGVVAGVPFALSTFHTTDAKSSFRIDAEDGARVSKGDTILFISAHARGLLSAERVALNFMQRLGDRDHDGALRRRRPRHIGEDPRHPKDNAGVEGAREVRGSCGRRSQPSHGSRDLGAHQGQSPRRGGR